MNNIYLHLVDGFEEIEALTVVDVLRRAALDIFTVSITDDKIVRGAHNIIVHADLAYTETNYNNGVMIVLPGGMPGTKNLGNHTDLANKIKLYHQQDKWIAAICAAPMILGRLGILTGKSVTCYPGFEDDLKGANIVNDSVIQSGKIITSRGPGCAMEFALKLVEVLKGQDTVNSLKKQMIIL